MLCRTKLLSALVGLLAFASLADAGPFRRGRRGGCSGSSCSQSSGYVECSQQQSYSYASREVVRESYAEELPAAKESSKDKRAASSADDALDEVNATRAARGLRPFLRDRLLTMAARRAANHRAVYCIEGHTNNDFSFIPGGGSAAAAGCGAWMPGDGWGTCCTYDTQYSYAGAAWAIGRDGRRYMHLFVR